MSVDQALPISFSEAAGPEDASVRNPWAYSERVCRKQLASDKPAATNFQQAAARHPRRCKPKPAPAPSETNDGDVFVPGKPLTMRRAPRGAPSPVRAAPA